MTVDPEDPHVILGEGHYQVDPLTIYIYFSLRLVLLLVEVVGFFPKCCNLGFHSMFGALY